MKTKKNLMTFDRQLSLKAIGSRSRTRKIDDTAVGNVKVEVHFSDSL